MHLVFKNKLLNYMSSATALPFANTLGYAIWQPGTDFLILRSLNHFLVPFFFYSCTALCGPWHSPATFTISTFLESKSSSLLCQRFRISIYAVCTLDLWSPSSPLSTNKIPAIVMKNTNSFLHIIFISIHSSRPGREKRPRWMFAFH